jgi:uncharacterized OB-fold protein
MAAFCACCGAEITPKAEACPACGAPQHGMVGPKVLETETRTPLPDGNLRLEKERKLACRVPER